MTLQQYTKHEKKNNVSRFSYMTYYFRTMTILLNQMTKTKEKNLPSLLFRIQIVLEDCQIHLYNDRLLMAYWAYLLLLTCNNQAIALHVLSTFKQTNFIQC